MTAKVEAGNKMRKMALILAWPLGGPERELQPLKSRDQLNQGVQAFKSAQYPEAVEHLRRRRSTQFPHGALYLASYMQQYIPGSISPENDQMAKPLTTVMKVLEQDPKNNLAIASVLPST